MSNFIDDYISYAKKYCHAPDIYHEMMARALVGMACRNKVYFQLGDTKIFPHCWMILIGKSSAWHKTTSIRDIALKIFDKVDENHRFADQWSPEALIPFLATKPSCTFFVDEFDAFMEIMKKDYMGGGQGFLRTLYDVPPKWSKKLAKEHYEIKYPTMTILSASTVYDFVKCVTEKDLRSGWLARYLLVYAKNKHPMSNILPPPVDENEKNKIVMELDAIVDAAGVNRLPDVEDMPPIVFTLKGELMDAYMKWQAGIDDEMASNPRVMPALSRLTIYLLKLSVIEAINVHETEIKMDHFNRAMGLVNTLHDSIVDLYKNEFTDSDFGVEVNQILDAIKSEPAGITLSGFKEHGVRLPKSRRNDILEQLEENGEIVVKSLRLLGSDKPTTYYAIRENKI